MWCHVRVTDTVDTARDDDPANFPTSRTRGGYIAKEHNAERVRYSVRRKGSSEVIGHLVREGTRWRYELPQTFRSLDEALDRVNELGL